MHRNGAAEKMWVVHFHKCAVELINVKGFSDSPSMYKFVYLKTVILDRQTIRSSKMDL